MEHKVSITGLAYGRGGVGRLGGKVVFVPFTAPGDEALVRITSEKKGFLEGALSRLVRPSDMRGEPRCAVYGICGGCAYQHIGYGHQVAWKEKIADETLKRIGKTTVAFDPAMPCERPYSYRTRARFHVKGGRWGLYELKTNAIVSVEECPILDPLVNAAYKEMRGFFLSHPGMRGAPEISSVALALSPLDDKVVSVFHCRQGRTGFDWEAVLSAVGRLKGLEVRTDEAKGAKAGLQCSIGDTLIRYIGAGIRYSTGISAFSQTNLGLNAALIDRVIDYAGLNGDETVLDLFSGSGNLTLLAAKRARKAIGVESDREAVNCAGNNALLNSIDNARFVREDSARWLGAYRASERAKGLETKGFDVVILDPPRGGAMPVALILKEIKPKKIIYVSCSPPTLARDLAVLAGAGYGNMRAIVVDMFPQTFHIETVASMEL